MPLSRLYRFFGSSKTGPADPGTPSPEYETMEGARELPRMLDSNNPDGGILKLMKDPGGTIGQLAGGERALAGEAIVRRGGRYERKDALPLLIQHDMEADQDYCFRAAIAAPRNLAWHSAIALASRPFRTGINTIDGQLPDQLKKDGAWLADIDGRRNTLRTFAEDRSSESVGMGLGYALVHYDSRQRRPLIRWLPAHAVLRVLDSADGKPARMHVHQIGSKPLDPSNRWGFPEPQHKILVYRRGNGMNSDPEKYASYQVYMATDPDGKQYSTTPAPVPDAEGEMVLRVDLRPHVNIPIIEWPTGTLGANHFILPPLLNAFKLDYLLFQMASNVEFNAIVSALILRFAKGLSARDIEDWKTLGPRQFYGTTSHEADMKFLAPAGTAVQAGMDVMDAIQRALDVASLAPMMHRPSRGPQERAFGQSQSAGRAKSAAQLYAIQREIALAETIAAMRLHDPRFADNTSLVKAGLSHDHGPTEEGMEAARLLADLYMRDKKIEPFAFWSEMQRRGIVSEDVDLDALVEFSRNEEMARLEMQRGRAMAPILWDMRKEGQLTDEGFWELMEFYKLIPSQKEQTIQVSEDGNAVPKTVEPGFVAKREMERLEEQEPEPVPEPEPEPVPEPPEEN